MTTKLCSKCNTTKDISEFSKDKTKKSGLCSNCKLCKRAYTEKNKKRIYEYHKIYYKLYREQNKETILEKCKKYRQTNNFKISNRNSSNKRRTITKIGDVTTQQLQELYENSNFCYWCNTNLKNKKIHLDHYIPLSKGGQHTLSNLVVSCPHCNHTKSSKDPIKFANSIGRLI